MRLPAAARRKGGGVRYEHDVSVESERVHETGNKYGKQSPIAT